MRVLAYWLYFECVNFTVHLANLTGTTYRDSNSFLFFILWPAVTVGLLLWVSGNALALRRATARSRSSRGARQTPCAPGHPARR
jgi:hypothetical protein